ncbi:hypothetical protein Fcan01_19271 [Folsomia candida]|uniref:Uncharacterized protein n=1 Tax=Folsomia candida TaxID=158441 RepID=A0A226DNZ1_FOLCA|nr:hypothetical protein Fcan01_19271 [Folsomia candida]
MYSKRAVLLIYVILGVSSYLGGSPIRFEISSKRFYSTKWTRLFCRLTTVLSTVQILFSIFCLYDFRKLTKYSKSGEIFTFNMIYIVTMCQIIPIICFLLLSVRGDVIARSLTRVLRYAKYIESKWWIVSSFVTSSAVVLHEILPSNWISLVPKKYWNTPMMWANYLTEAYFITISSVVVVTVCSVITFQVAFTYPFHTEFCVNPKSGKFISLPEFRTEDVLPLEYRKFEQLHNYYMPIFGPTFIPFQSIVMQFSLFSNWMLLNYWGTLGILRLVLILMEAGLISFWTIILEFGGRFYEASKRNKESWRQLGEQSKFVRKWRKSVRHLYAGYEGYHVIRRLSVLKFLKGIVRGTFRILLTFND